MPRRLKFADELAAQQAEAASSVASFARAGKRKTKGPDPEHARAQLREMLVANDFTKATPTVLVALYEWLHEQVYGARPVEIARRAVWKTVAFAAGKLVKNEFRDDVGAVVDFMRWCWDRERTRMARQQPERRMGRIGWRLQFVTGHLLTDYRISKASR